MTFLSPWHPFPNLQISFSLSSTVSPQRAVMSHWMLHLCSQQRTFVVALECAIIVLNVFSGGTSPRTSELKWGSRMHVLIEGSLNRLHCCGNETPAANEHRLDCFLVRKRAKTSPWSQSVHGSSASSYTLLLLLLLPSSVFTSSSNSLINFLKPADNKIFLRLRLIRYCAKSSFALQLPSIQIHAVFLPYVHWQSRPTSTE